MNKLPIERVLSDLQEILRTHVNAVLVASPGAGKTTRVPLSLLDEPWLSGRRILMLEPRRLAARTAAQYMAASLGEIVGETVGYRVRRDTQVGPKTRIEVITEGVLTRLLQSDPALENVGMVIFDEFHERNLHSDLGLALCLQSQSLLREDLRVLVMSATLDGKSVSELLDDAPILVSEGRSYPVETHYLSAPIKGTLENEIVKSVRTALAHQEGDILVFLPGAGEIRRVEEKLMELDLGLQARCYPLYANLSREAQEAAIAPSPFGERKIVLATSIAETSLTILGVRVVIDGGWIRVPRFSPRTGMTRLETVRVSRASADQRRGRAGRLGPGACYRLWTEQEDRVLSPHHTPEMMEADLTSLALELAAWGISDPHELLWLTPPPEASYKQARELLCQLGALDKGGGLLPHGRRMAELGLHPRLAHMILTAMPLGYGEVACELAAILNERDFFRTSHGAVDADLRNRMQSLRCGESVIAKQGYEIDQNVRKRVLTEARYWKQVLGVQVEKKNDVDACGLLLAFAYPDRIGLRRGSGRFLLRNGRGAVLPESQPLAQVAALVAAELDDQGLESRIFLAASIDLEEVENYFSDQIKGESLVYWDGSQQMVRARKRLCLGALILRDHPLPEPNSEEVMAALLQGVKEEGLGMLSWTKSARQLQQRLIFMHELEPEKWPDMKDEALLETLSDWLTPHLYGLKSRQDVQRLHLSGILESVFSWDERKELEAAAPTHVVVPSGSRIPIDYSDPLAPVLAVRLQELFGLIDTPRVAQGKVPLTLHLLSPANRPVQVTRDLPSFWKKTYFEVKKDLKGRYPKHYWPDDPFSAVPTNRVRPKI